MMSGSRSVADQPSPSRKLSPGSKVAGWYIPAPRPQANPNSGSHRSPTEPAARCVGAGGVGVGFGVGLTVGVGATVGVGRAVGVGVGRAVGLGTIARPASRPGSAASSRPPVTTAPTAASTSNGPAIAGEGRRAGCATAVPPGPNPATARSPAPGGRSGGARSDAAPGRARPVIAAAGIAAFDAADTALAAAATPALPTPPAAPASTERSTATVGLAGSG